jgi:hypothetical protein
MLKFDQGRARAWLFEQGLVTKSNKRKKAFA